MSPREERPDDDAVEPAGPASPEVVRAGMLRLRLVAVVLVGEALLLAGVAVFVVANLVGGSAQTTDTANAVIEAVSFAVFAALLLLLARACVRGRRWARAPVIVVELIALLGVGVNLLQGDLWYRFWLGVPLTLGSALAVLALLTPSVAAVLDADE